MLREILTLRPAGPTGRSVARGAGLVPVVAQCVAPARRRLDRTEHDGDEDQACAALLHGAIEDGGAAWEAVIEERFGPRVAGIVRACTDADTQPKPPWRARKQAYLAHLATEGPDALLVSAADKLHNARAIVSDLHTLSNDIRNPAAGDTESPVTPIALMPRPAPVRCCT